MRRPGRRFAALLAGGLMLTALAGAAAQDAEAPGDGPAIAVTESGFGRTAQARAGDCPVALDYRPAQQMMHYRNSCRQPAAEKLALLAAMLPAVLGADAPPRIALYAGRLAQTFPDLAAELAVAAANTSIWDEDRAIRSPPFANAVARQLLERLPGAAAIGESLFAHGWRVTGIAIERVLIGRPREMPFPLPPQLVRVMRDKRLPFDGLLWIGLTPA